MNSQRAQAQQRALLILQVQAGQITATAAAQQLGLSRKSYYQWQRRALAALLQAVEQQPPGRPPKTPDPHNQQLLQQVAQLQQKVTRLEQVLELRQVVHQLHSSHAKKNSPSCKRSSTKPPPFSPPPG